MKGYRDVLPGQYVACKRPGGLGAWPFTAIHVEGQANNEASNPTLVDDYEESIQGGTKLAAFPDRLDGRSDQTASIACSNAKRLAAGINSDKGPGAGQGKEVCDWHAGLWSHLLNLPCLARIATSCRLERQLMSVTKDDVRKAAQLSRIAVSEERLEPLANELSAIIGWIEQLNEVDVEGVEPMTSVVDAKLPLREDVVTDGNIQDQVLANAPKSEDGFFVVPKSVE